MSKLGYDETNFTDAIVDLGKCENENKDLKRQILELKQTIKDLNVYKQEIENLLHNSRFRGYGGKKYRTKRIKNKKNKSRRLKCKKV